MLTKQKIHALGASSNSISLDHSMPLYARICTTQADEEVEPLGSRPPRASEVQLEHHDHCTSLSDISLQRS